MASKAQRAVPGVPPERWGQLGKALQEWREDELGYKVRTRFAAERLPPTPDGNVNARLIQDLEKNYRPGTVTKFSLEDIEKAYGITHESVLAFLHGEADKLARAQDAAPGELAVVDPLALPPSPFGDPARDAADRPYAEAIWRRYLDLPRRVTEPDGAQMFPGDPADAAAWDGFGARLPLGDRVWFIADVRRWEDGPAPNSGTGEAAS